MIKKMAVLLLVLSFVASASSAYAFPASPWTAEATKSEQARAKLNFGLKNLFLGWTEVLTEPYEASKSGDVFSGIKAIGEGLFNGILDTAGGAVHFATFPCPAFDVPLPEGGTDIDKVLGG